MQKTNTHSLHYKTQLLLFQFICTWKPWNDFSTHMIRGPCMRKKEMCSLLGH